MDIVINKTRPTKRAPRLRCAARGELPDARTNAEDRLAGRMSQVHAAQVSPHSLRSGTTLYEGFGASPLGADA